MDKQTEAPITEHRFQVLTLILSEHQCQKCIRIAKEIGIRGGIVTMGKGTLSSATLKFLGIKSQKREIVSFPLEKEKAKEVLDCFTKELQLHERGHGIAFTTPVLYSNQVFDQAQATSSTLQCLEDNGMFKKLTVIVDRGMAEDVMDIARKAGVRGGTIMHGRGAGAEFTEKLFGVDIEPEKELVIILVPSDLVDNVVNVLYNELQLDKPGKGILFVEPVLETRGLFESSRDNKDA